MAPDTPVREPEMQDTPPCQSPQAPSRKCLLILPACYFNFLGGVLYIKLSPPSAASTERGYKIRKTNYMKDGKQQ